MLLEFETLDGRIILIPESSINYIELTNTGAILICKGLLRNVRFEVKGVNYTYVKRRVVDVSVGDSD